LLVRSLLVVGVERQGALVANWMLGSWVVLSAETP
jgi:hypothetical protein